MNSDHGVELAAFQEWAKRHNFDTETRHNFAFNLFADPETNYSWQGFHAGWQAAVASGSAGELLQEAYHELKYLYHKSHGTRRDRIQPILGKLSALVPGAKP